MKNGFVAMSLLVFMTTVMAVAALGIGVYTNMQVRKIRPVINYTVIAPTPTITPTPTFEPTATPAAGLRRVTVPVKRVSPTEETVIATPTVEK